MILIKAIQGISEEMRFKEMASVYCLQLIMNEEISNAIFQCII